jgi:hypothetical protein
VVDILTKAEKVYLSAVTVGEREGGLVLGSRPEENRTNLRAFVSEPFVPIVNVDVAVATLCGNLFGAPPGPPPGAE